LLLVFLSRSGVMRRTIGGNLERANPPWRRLMRRGDWIGFPIVAIGVGLLQVFRARVALSPAWDAACEAARPPLLCAPRAWLFWSEYWGVWGGAALLLGVFGLAGRRLMPSVAAVALGVAAVLDGNVSFGLLGAALGAWAWIGRLVTGAG
jgi:hypothetical protein